MHHTHQHDHNNNGDTQHDHTHDDMSLHTDMNHTDNDSNHQPTGDTTDHHDHHNGHYTTDKEVIAEAEHFCDIIFHFAHYATYHEKLLTKHISDYNTLSTIHQSLLPHLPSQHQNTVNLLYANQRFIEQLIDIRDVFYNWPVDWQKVENDSYNNMIDTEKMSKVRSTLKQCVRDWAAEGQVERQQCYQPILDKLHELYGDQVQHSTDIRVLVPGAGLCRLVWDIARLGFITQGNEFSYFMLVCSYYILNCCIEKQCETIYPYITETKNWVDINDRLQEVRIPDVNTRDIPTTTRLSMVAGDFYEIYNDLEGNLANDVATHDHTPKPSNRAAFDCICTCYFIDCAPNILDYISTISYILQVGGKWITFGPLLYHFSDVPGEISIDLTWNEIVGTLPKFGLKLIEQKLSNRSTYTQSTANIMQQSYNCVFAVIEKVGTDTTRDPETQRAPPQSHRRK